MSKDDSQGLPMTAKWDPEKLQKEIEGLQELERRPFLPKVGGYLKRSGPGLLQSAMTLGAGSAAASVVAGASFGYKLLWVQPLAMFLGVCMMAALSNVVLTTQEKPYRSFAKYVGWPLVFLWALGTISASVIWHFPQYGLAAGSVRDLGAMVGTPTEVSFFSHTTKDGAITYYVKAFEQKKEEPAQSTREAAEKNIELAREASPDRFKTAAVIYVETPEKWQQIADEQKLALEKGVDNPYKPQNVITAKGKKLSIATGIAILLVNIVTVWSYGSSRTGIKIYENFLRLMICLVILSFALVVVCNVGNIEWVKMFRGFLGLDAAPILKDKQNLILVLGMLGAAVGINMTFLYPYSILAKGWGPHHKTLAKWDLGMSMFLPFALVTSLIMIGMTVGGVYEGDVLRSGLKPLDASKVLVDLLGPTGRVIFDLGLIGMTCGAVSTHMVVCGFTLPEMFGLKYTKWTFRICALLPAVGVMGVMLQLPFWFPVFASAICFTMLPIAYLIFFLMNNNRKYIGDAVGSGVGRWVFNAILLVALIFTVISAAIMINDRVIKPLQALNKPTAAPVETTDADAPTVDANAPAEGAAVEDAENANAQVEVAPTEATPEAAPEETPAS
ncbi:MAG: divalent metal cation transporter [Planctomycetia bacterium]|nr:divalent metal cation transporter [Planctomycetia bacterium]